VRDKIGGGPPRAGELQNVTDDAPPYKITVKKDQKLKGISLKVDAFSGKGSPEPQNNAIKVWKNIRVLQQK
jgi:hypothetical protein